MPKKQWLLATKCVEQIRTEGGFFNFIRRHADIAQELSKSVPTCVCCMDGRIASHENAIAIAGSGILIKDDPEARARLIAELKKRGIKKLTSHDECGALKLYAQKNGLSIEEAEEHMTAWLNELAEEIESTERPERLPVEFHFHHESCVYIVLTDRFFAKAQGHLPVGFELSASAVSKEHLLDEVKIALEIAFSEHGFGDWFTEESPFSVVIVAPDEMQMREWQELEALNAIITPYGDRVVIDGFVLSETEAPLSMMQAEPAVMQA